MLITDPILAREFVLAGRAVFTIKSHRTGEHYTFRVAKVKDDGDKYFVSMLTTGDVFTYMGMMHVERGFWLTGKSQFTDSSPNVRAFRWFMSYLIGANELPSQAELRHEGRCGKCARPLTHPESIDRGIGPECAKRLECV